MLHVVARHVDRQPNAILRNLLHLGLHAGHSAEQFPGCAAETSRDTQRTMGWTFRKRKKLVPGVTLNLGKRSASVSVGPRGAKVSAGARGLSATLSLLGTGLTYVWRRKRR